MEAVVSAESCACAAPLTTKLAPGNVWKVAAILRSALKSCAHAARRRKGGIGQGGRDVGRSRGVTNERTCLEQVGTSGAKTIREREVGAATGERKPGQREWRKTIVGADGRACDAAGRAVRSHHRVAIGGLRTAKARGPHAPPLRERLSCRLP